MKLIRITFLVFTLMLVYNASYSYKVENEFAHFKNEEDTLDKVFYLKKYYKEAANGNEESKRLFFNIFPDSFTELESLYGFGYGNDTHKGPKPLYFEVTNHIGELFFKLDEVVGKDRFYRKMLDLTIGELRETDAMFQLQYGLQEKVKADVTSTVKVLKGFSDDKINKVWYFHFYSPHPKNLKDVYETLYLEIEAMDVRVAKLMKQSYEQLLKEFNGH